MLYCTDDNFAEVLCHLIKSKFIVMKLALARTGLFLFALVLCNTAQAKIWRLNNNGNTPNPAIVADFTGTLQATHDNAAVASGDTIHVEQSPTTYGNCIFTKRLVVIGAGYFLNKNPFTQVNIDYGSTVGDLTFYNNNAAGSHVYGLITGAVYMGVNNLLIARCNLTSLLFIGNTGTADLNGMTLRQCFLTGSTAQNQSVVRSNTGTGLITNMDFSNNIFKLPNYYNVALNLSDKVSGLFKNNFIDGNLGIYIKNFYVLNNIQFSSSNTGNNFTNCVVEYNTGTVATMFVSPAGTNNTIGLGNQTKTAAQIALLGGTSTDNTNSLAVASECIGAGKDGTDCGAFGGDYPYKLSGIAPVPNIYKVIIAPISAGSSSISVTVSAKGNN